MAATADDVLEFWFAPGIAERWFKKDPAFDDEVRRVLLPLHEGETVDSASEEQNRDARVVSGIQAGTE